MADILAGPLDQVDTGAGRAEGLWEVRVLEEGGVGGDDPATGAEPNHTAGAEAAGAASLHRPALQTRLSVTAAGCCATCSQAEYTPASLHYYTVYCAILTISRQSEGLRQVPATLHINNLVYTEKTVSSQISTLHRRI